MPGFGIVLSNNNVAQGNIITRSGWFGIEILGGSNNLVSDNIVENNGLGGIAVNASTFIFLAECSIDEIGNPFDCGVRSPLTDLSVEGDAFNNVIRNNRIAFNHGPGIVIGGRFKDFNGNERRAAHNSLSGNIIYANEGLGIDLSDETRSVFFAAEEPIVGAFGEIVLAMADGVTPNNSAILANDGQNFPMLTSARATAGGLVVRGTMDTADPRTIVIEFFANPMPMPGSDPSGYGEGAVFLGQARPNRQGKFTASLPPVPIGTLITATATDADGNTSEFAKNIEAQFQPGR
jgi:parallel beta-helix repeat protein